MPLIGETLVCSFALVALKGGDKYHVVAFFLEYIVLFRPSRLDQCAMHTTNALFCFSQTLPFMRDNIVVPCLT